MVEQQLRLGIADKLSDLPAQLAVGDADRFNLCHENNVLALGYVCRMLSS
jgi:hypothetical protein